MEGFKTDTHMEMMVIFADIQDAFSSGETRECVSCSYDFKVAGYCFKCHGYLCFKCSTAHPSGDTTADHLHHMLARNMVDPENLTLDELASLTEAPRCHVLNHGNRFAQQCCSTCANLPVCVDCIHNDHQTHSLDSVTLVSKSERERMNNKIEVLRREMRYLDNLKGRINNVQRQLDANVTEKRSKIRSLYDRESSEIEIRLRENSEELDRSLDLINNEENEVLRGVHQERSEEMFAISEKYQRIIDSILIENENKRQRLKVKHLKRETNITSKEQTLDKVYQSLNNTIAKEQSENLEEIERILEHSNNTLSRLQNLDTTVFSIMGMRDEWKDVLYLPDISVASEPLVKDVIKEFPQLEELSDFPVGELKPVYIDHGTITEDSVVDIEGIDARGWQINGMTSVGEGSIVVTGRVSDEASHITVINAKGKMLRQPERKKKTRRSMYSPFRYCASLTESKIATTCQCSSNILALFDARNGSSSRKDITEVTTKEGSSTSWHVSCMATSSAKKQILVGSFDRRDVHVFTDQLKHSHTLLLPDVVRWPRDMAVYHGNLLVCDDEGGRACLVTMATPQADEDTVVECSLVCELPKPGLQNSDCRPICICTDTSGFIYMLWDVTIAGQLKSVLVQYSQDGRQLLTKRPVDGNARSLATMETKKGEKLLIATERTGKLYSYGLVSIYTSFIT